MSLYFSSAVDIAVLMMGENPKEAQDAPSANAPRGAMSDDKLKVSGPSFSSSQLRSRFFHHCPRNCPDLTSNPFVLPFQLPAARGQFGTAAECNRLPQLPQGSYYLGLYPYPPSGQSLTAEQVCGLTAFSMWDLAGLPSNGPAKVFVREDDLSKTYESETGEKLFHPLTSPAACRKAEAVGLTLFNITADVREQMSQDPDWNYSGDTRVGHVVFLLAMARNTLTNGIEAFGGMVYCHPFQRRYPFRKAWQRLTNMVGKGEPLGPEPPAVVAAVAVPRHPEWTCPAYPRDTYVTWGGQPREAIGPINELIGYPLLNVGVIRETALWFSCMLLLRSFNNGQVGTRRTDPRRCHDQREGGRPPLLPGQTGQRHTEH